MRSEGDLTAEVETLRRRLADAEQSLQAVARGEVDAVAHASLTTPILLHQAQEDLRRNEQLLRAVFNGVDDGILLVNSAGVFLDANAAACTIFGAAKSEVVGKRTEDFAAPGYDTAAERNKIITAGQRRGMLEILRPDGARRVLEYHATRDILPGLHLSVVRDVTELNRAEKALVASEKRYRQIVDTAGEGIWLIDDQARTTFANRALEEMLGRAPGEMLGKSVFDFVDPSEHANTERSIERRRQGVAERREQKYLHKDGSLVWVLMEASPMSDEQGNYAGALAMVTNVTDRKRAEEATRASEERYRLLFESSPLPIWLTDLDTLRFLAVNRAALQLFGYERDAFLELRLNDLLSGEEAIRLPEALGAPGERGVRQGVWHPRNKTGRVLEVAITAQAFVLDGRAVGLVIAQDMTEQNRLEAALAQSRKMEAIGLLAGGIAHDFNNLLSIIVTYGTFALEALQPGDPIRADIEEVAQAGQRAVSLTRQLLAFSRKQILAPTIMDLNLTISGIEPMLRLLVGEDIDISIVAEPALGRVSADAGQIEQVIMNLVVNARDAMPAGGELTIETANLRVGEATSGSPPGLKPGWHVKLAVSDTGSGIDAATQQRIFEPFFTTKEVGKGTGLGLATVLGIVQQSGGQLEVQSELGKGTSFEIYLPRVDGASSVQPAPLAAAQMGGSETILVVEDDEQVRGLTRSILRRHGYEVLIAANGGEAFLIAEQYPSSIDLLLTDMVMPRMNGRQLAERLATTRPDMKVLFMTGYTDDAVVRQGVFDADLALLQKPITPETLARRVRAVLDGPIVGGVSR